MSVRILTGDCRAMLKTLPDESVHCAVTSPPYWGLRDYGVDGQLGLEATLIEHIETIVDVFREVRRVLRKDGTVWLNYGDCYATSPNGRSAADTKAVGNDDRSFRDKPFSTVGGTLKPKDLVMMPARVAIALQDDGWWLRSDIIWHKPNPMPESIKDRPTTAHEHVFLLAKSARYYFDHEAVREQRFQDEDANGFRGGSYTENKPGKRKTVGNYKMPDGWATHPGGHGSFHRDGRENGKAPDRGRQTYGRHTLRSFLPEFERRPADQDRKYATDGNDAFRRHAGTGETSTLRVLERLPRKRGQPPRHEQYDSGHQTLDDFPRGLGRHIRNVWTIATTPYTKAHFATFPPALVEPCIKAGCPEGGVVLDPFGGAGTVGMVADRLKRNAILIELNPEYCDMARRRIQDDGGMFVDVEMADE